MSVYGRYGSFVIVVVALIVARTYVIDRDQVGLFVDESVT